VNDSAINPPAPTGYRLFRGAELVDEYSCPCCPERFCHCFSTAWSRAKREARLRGGLYRIETFDGRTLATTKPATAAEGKRRTAATEAAAEAPHAEEQTERAEPAGEREEGDES
jgi:hypothetical protein